VRWEDGKVKRRFFVAGKNPHERLVQSYGAVTYIYTKATTDNGKNLLIACTCVGNRD
jgi:hypothetical protein